MENVVHENSLMGKLSYVWIFLFLEKWEKMLKRGLSARAFRKKNVKKRSKEGSKQGHFKGKKRKITQKRSLRALQKTTKKHDNRSQNTKTSITLLIRVLETSNHHFWSLQFLNIFGHFQVKKIANKISKNVSESSDIRPKSTNRSKMLQKFSKIRKSVVNSKGESCKKLQKTAYHPRNGRRISPKEVTKTAITSLIGLPASSNPYFWLVPKNAKL